MPLFCPPWLTGFCYCALVCQHQGNKEYYNLGGVNSLRFIGVQGSKEVCVEVGAGPEGPPPLSLPHRIKKGAAAICQYVGRRSVGRESETIGTLSFSSTVVHSSPAGKYFFQQYSGTHL